MKKRVITILGVGIGIVLLAPLKNFSYTKTIFTLAEINAIKQEQNCPSGIEKKTSPCIDGASSSKNLPKPFTSCNYEWWQLFPTTGLSSTTEALSYPYLPHSYGLWELAPHLGKGVSVTLIDTGVFGFTFSTPTQTFIKHPDLTIVGDFTHEPHNTIPFVGKNYDSFKELVTFVVHHTKENLRDKKKVYRLLPEWILEYLTTKTTSGLDEYLQENGSPGLFERNILFFLSPKKLLSVEGRRIKNTLLFGNHGFVHFTIATIGSGQKIIAECIPMVSLVTPKTAMTDHGTHLASIIGAKSPFFKKLLTKEKKILTGLCGLAPECSLRVIKALHEEQGVTTDVNHIAHAFERALDYQTDIINLSLKLDDTIDPYNPLFKKLEKIVTTFPYVCCATGNQGTTKPGRISYPARFKNVPFSVGSFGCYYDIKTNNYSCPLSSFSQYEKGVGPHFVAPGENILGCSYAYAGKEPLYSLKTGTSCATAFMSGALALILSEFKNDFSSSQIRAVCQASCFKLHDTKEWKECVIYGVLDIRTALFTLHVLKKIKILLSLSIVEKKFDFLLSSIHTELFTLPNNYGKEQKFIYSFKESFIDYYNESLARPVKKELAMTVNEAIDTIATKVIAKNSFPSRQ
jgi:subtilisin family serine protease